MKKIYSIFAALMMAATMLAQNTDNLALAVYVEDMAEPFPASAKVQLTNKLNQLLTQNGVASSNYFGQFFITAFAVPQTKDVIPGPPMQYAETMEFTFYIADYSNQLVFATTSVKAKGVGTTDAKSYMDALKHINLQSSALKNFITEGKNKIIAYYEAEAPRILADARVKAGMKQYEEAIYLCTTIPAQCSAYSQAQALQLEVYQMYIDEMCRVNLQKAKAVWASEQNAYGAEQAGEYLSQILPDASCYADAEVLYKEIKAKVLDDWKFEMKQYQDQIDLEKERIKASRDVGVAYGNHQQPTTTNIGFLR